MQDTLQASFPWARERRRQEPEQFPGRGELLAVGDHCALQMKMPK